MLVQSLGWEDPVEKKMATHFSSLAWEIPWTEEPGVLQFMGSQSQTQLSNRTTTIFFPLELSPFIHIVLLLLLLSRVNHV